MAEYHSWSHGYCNSGLCSWLPCPNFAVAVGIRNSIPYVHTYEVLKQKLSNCVARKAPKLPDFESFLELLKTLLPTVMT